MTHGIRFVQGGHSTSRAVGRKTPSSSAPHPQSTPCQPPQIIARAQHQRRSRGWCPRHCRRLHQLQPPHSRS
ncbi:hypothetical protein K438DRAFT_1834259, partial [Mycena galopus ATCC 62051]